MEVDQSYPTLGRGGHLAWTEGTRIFRESLGPGFHLVSERSFGPAPSPREDRIWEAIPTLNTAQPPDPEIAREFLAHHDDDPAQATCVHLEALGYGTRSWTHILYQREPGGFVWHEADGPPCTTPAVQVLPELPISG